jgi:hypothetical protein
MRRLGMVKLAEFDHPNLAPDSALRRHVLYKIENQMPIAPGQSPTSQPETYPPH